MGHSGRGIRIKKLWSFLGQEIHVIDMYLAYNMSILPGTMCLVNFIS